jgi:hypothetical protein
MTGVVNDMARGLILDDLPNARNIAKSFVELIVANPEQNRDFETYVRSRILETPRAKTIYARKPESISHEQFLQPYVQAFMQQAGPGFGDQLAETAIGGARLHASPQAYQARLDKTRQVQSGAPFLQNLRDHLLGLKGGLSG